jgi:hypothetical protein
MGLKQYDPTMVTVSVAGIEIGEFAKGTFVEVDREADGWGDEVGAGGEVVRFRIADKRGTIKLTLMKSSASNDALSALAIADDLDGTGVGPAQVKDLSGTSLHHAEQSWVKKIPAAPYGTEATTTEWEIRCAALDHTVGGNNAVGA